MTNTYLYQMLGRKIAVPVPTDPYELPPPDGPPMTITEMAAALRANFKPCADPCKPLGFDPDDYPFR